MEKASSLNLTCLLRTKGDGDVTAATVAEFASSSSSSSASAAASSESRLRWYKDGKVRLDGIQVAAFSSSKRSKQK